jgi:hypothetical protein
MNFFYLILLINFSFYLCDGNALSGNTPYSIKIGFDEAVTFTNINTNDQQLLLKIHRLP